MAARKTAAPEAPEPTPIDIGVDASDLGIPVLAVVHTQSNAFTAEKAKFGDLIISEGGEDGEVTVMYSNADGDEPLRCYMVGRLEKWLMPKFGEGDQGERYELGDPSAPAYCQEVHRYTLLVPSYSTIMPVHFYTRSSSLGTMRPLLNQLKLAATEGIPPYRLAFSMKTTRRPGGPGKGPYFVPIPQLVEGDPIEIEAGGSLYEQFKRPTQPQLAATATAAPKF